MAQRITYSPTTAWGSQVAGYATAVAKAQAQGARILDTMNSMCGGGAGPFDQLEAEFQLAEGDGMPFYQAFNEAQSQLAEIDIAPLDQGGF